MPLPGATALVGAGILASDGKLNILLVCLIALPLAVLGANVSYAIGRKYGSRALTIQGPLARQRRHILELGEPLIQRYGWLAVLTGRSFPVLRESNALLAGSFEMRWRWFLVWTTLGGIFWVLIHALLGYYVGTVAGVERGLEIILAFKLVSFAIYALYIVVRRRRDKRSRDTTDTKPPECVT